MTPAAGVTRHRLDGSLIDELALPGVGTVTGFGGRQDADETFFSFTNYITPGAIYRVNLQDGTTSLWRQGEIAIDVSEFVTEQVFCNSKDGTKIPMIITPGEKMPRSMGPTKHFCTPTADSIFR